MNTLVSLNGISRSLVVAGISWATAQNYASAVTTVFFDASQSTNLVQSGTTFDSISSEGYLFTYTRDKLFTGGVGLTNPIGRMVRVAWPDGLEAQAITTGAIGPAKMVISRVDKQPFAIASFTAKLLANTAGAGGSWEIMPQLNGEDGVPNPFVYDATGIAGNSFSYTTPELAGFDTYQMTLYVDYAITSITLVDASLPPPYLDVTPIGGSWLQLSWPTNAVGYTLEGADVLPATVWTAVTNPVTVNFDVYTVDLETTAQQRFFRLKK